MDGVPKRFTRRSVLGIAGAAALVPLTGARFDSPARIIRVGTAVAAPTVVGESVFGHRYYVAFPAGGGYGGAEPNRKINIMRGSDIAHPTVMDEWSNDNVALTIDYGLYDRPGWQMLLAWAGNDPARRLNLAVSSDGVRFDKMTTMTHTALGGPALARSDKDGLFLAWTGGAGLGGGQPDRHINVLSFKGGHVVLPRQSIAGPAIIANADVSWDGQLRGDHTPRLYVAWTDAEGHMFTTYCVWSELDQLKDPAHLVRIETDGRTEHTFTSPGLAANGNRLYLSWPEVSGSHRINFKILYGVNAGQKITLNNETASSAISMETYTLSYGDGMYAYRGTDGVGGVYVTSPMPL